MVSRSRSTFSQECPVCSWNPSSRDGIVNQVLTFIRTSGQFSHGSPGLFWQTFKAELCLSCQSNLDAMIAKRQQARKLLEEAAKLDPNNDMIQKNLEAAKKMV